MRDSGWAGLPIPPAVESWRFRAAWLHSVEVEKTGASQIPDLSEAALLARLDGWLGLFCAGVRTRAQLQKLDWGAILRGQVRARVLRGLASSRLLTSCVCSHLIFKAALAT